MKRLTLLRHAKSDAGSPGLADIDRPLNDRGRRAAERMGAWLADEGVRFDRVIASPAARVRETLALLSTGYGELLPLKWDARLYLASLDTILAIVRACPDETGSLLVVGHNPGLQQTVLTLVPEGDGDPCHAKVAETYPAAGLAELELEAASWTCCRPGGARLIRFTRPRDLAPVAFLPT